MTELVTTVGAFQDFCQHARRPLALVPTLGALHEGHASLVRQARSDCATVAVSVFVNPTQFDASRDLERYPRPLEEDMALLRQAGADIVFAPSVEEVYPEGFVTLVECSGPALGLEGAARPGHFQGVTTVVTKLLAMAQPDAAYFGQKDAQQLAVVRRLVTDLNIPVRIQAVSTVREADGLAMSSRNSALSPEDRAAARVVYRSLSAVVDLYGRGQMEASELEAGCRHVLESEPRIDRIDYVALVDPITFAPASPADGNPVLFLVAVRFGDTRLLDNVVLGG